MRKILKEYIYYIQYTEPRSELTVKSYQKDLNDFIDYLESHDVSDFNDVDYDLLLNYLSFLESEYKRTTIDRKISSIRNFFKYCHQYGHVSHNVTSYLQSQKRAIKLPQILTENDLRTLLSFDLVTGKDYLDIAILKVLFSTGIRVSECVNLSFSQIYEKEKWLKIVGKGNKERMVPISEDAFSALNKYIQKIRPQFEKIKSSKVFLNQKGNQITRQYVHTMIQLRSKETHLNKKISAHTLRHTLATTMLNHSVDLRVIQEILGHSDIKTTQIYTHVDSKALKNEYDQFLDVDFSNKGGNDDEV